MNSQENPPSRLKDWDEFNDNSLAYWRSVRASIEHENQLVNYRITWLLAFEALLFGALGIFVKEYLEYMKHVSMPPLRLYFIALFGFVNIGIIAALYIERYMRGAEDAHEALVKWWRDWCKDNPSSSTNPPIAGSGDLDPTISLQKFNLEPSEDSFNYLIAKFTRQSRYPLLFVLAWLSFNYTILGYFSSFKSKQVSSLASIGWLSAVLLPLLILLIWAMTYLFSRQKFKKFLRDETNTDNLKLNNCILAFLVTACLSFAIRYSELFGPWGRSLAWLFLIPWIPWIVLLAVFGIRKGWSLLVIQLRNLRRLRDLRRLRRLRRLRKLRPPKGFSEEQFDGAEGLQVSNPNTTNSLTAEKKTK
jgi:hypothetical protein